MNFRNLLLGIGIVIVYALLLWQASLTFFPDPDFSDFCGQDEFIPRPFPIDGEQCNTSTALIVAQQECSQQGNYFHSTYDENGCLSAGFCDDCNKQYDEARESRARIVFIFSLIIAVITFAVGYFVLSIEPVGTALVGSSIWAVFYGSVVNWSFFGAALQFVLLLIAFIALVWFAVWLNKKNRAKSKDSIKVKSKQGRNKTGKKKNKGFWARLRS